MKILGIDYGRAKIGLSISDGKLAEPLRVVRVSNIEDAVEKIGEIVKSEKIKKVVVGVSEGEMGRESIDFSVLIEHRFRVKVFTSDETLSSQEAQQMAIASGVSQKKRREMEDAYAATIMLQNYLDNQQN